MATSIAELPPELLEMIAAELEEANELISLRSVCRELHRKLNDAFARQYFPRRCIWVNASKISELEDICKVPRLAAQVKRLEVLCDPEEELIRIRLASAVGLAFQHCPNLKEIDFTDQKTEAPTKPEKWNPDPWGPLVDISATFAAVMFAIEAQCGRPVAVRIYSRSTSDVGIVETGRLPYLTSSLTMTEVLAVNILTHPDLDSTL